MTKSTSDAPVQTPSKEIFSVNGYVMLIIISFIFFAALMIGLGHIGTKLVKTVSAYSLATEYVETTPY